MLLPAGPSVTQAAESILLSPRLPRPLTSFVAREEELSEIETLILGRATRLLTLVGAGGTGKTRLALQVAGRLKASGETIHFVDLSPLSDARLVIPSIARSLGISDDHSIPLQERLEQALIGHHATLLLDNFEQVIEAGQDVMHLAEVCSDLQVVITSREPLDLYGEHEFAVLPLPVPDMTQPASDGEIANNPAVRLFVERAAAVRRGVHPPGELEAIAEICSRLDGLPLAIELAAARTKVLTPKELLERMGRGSDILVSTELNRPQRHQTLAATVAWSLRLLTEQEKLLFERLAVFVRGWSLEAAQSTCYSDTIPPDEIPNLLTSLVGKSLVVAHAESDNPTRYHFLETLRQVAAERLSELGSDVFRQRHATYYLAYARRASVNALGPRQHVWIQRLENEFENFRGAMTWATEVDRSEEDRELGAQLAASLGWFCFVRGHAAEGLRWCELFLHSSGNLSWPTRLQLATWAGHLAWALRDYTRAAEFGEQALTLAREAQVRFDAQLWVGPTGLEECTALALGALAYVAIYAREFDKAARFADEALAIARDQIGQVSFLATWFRLQANLHLSQGALADAAVLFEQSLSLSREGGDTRNIALALHGMGLVRALGGAFSQAIDLLSESLPLFERIGDFVYALGVREKLARVSLMQGDVLGAGELYALALAGMRRVGDQRGIVDCLEGIAALQLAKRQPSLAIQLLGTAEQLRETLRLPMSPAELPLYRRVVNAASAMVAPETFTATWADGKCQPVEVAIEQALLSLRNADERGEAGTRNVGQQGPGSIGPAASPELTTPPGWGELQLTKRELEVLRLLADGLSNKDIATTLVLSVRTVERHVANIYQKLEIHGRASATVYALRHPDLVHRTH